MDFNQLTTLEEVENFIWHIEVPSDQISKAVDLMMALAFSEEVVGFNLIFTG